MLESPHSVRRIRLPNEGQPTGDDHARHQSDCTSEQGSDIRNARAMRGEPFRASRRFLHGGGSFYLTSEDHANEFVMTAQDADPRQDRITLSGNRFRHIDMVLIDDFQYFAGRTALQEQLLQTLKALHQAGRYSPRYAANRSHWETCEPCGPPNEHGTLQRPGIPGLTEMFTCAVT